MGRGVEGFWFDFLDLGIRVLLSRPKDLSRLSALVGLRLWGCRCCSVLKMIIWVVVIDSSRIPL